MAHACGGDASRLRSFGARFAGVVMPGDTITTRGRKLAPKGDGARFAVEVVNQAGQVVISNGVVEVA